MTDSQINDDQLPAGTNAVLGKPLLVVAGDPDSNPGVKENANEQHIHNNNDNNNHHHHEDNAGDSTNIVSSPEMYHHHHHHGTDKLLKEVNPHSNNSKSKVLASAQLFEKLAAFDQSDPGSANTNTTTTTAATASTTPATAPAAAAAATTTTPAHNGGDVDDDDDPSKNAAASAYPESSKSSVYPSEPPLSKSTESFDVNGNDSQELADANSKLEAKLSELKLLSKSSASLSSSEHADEPLHRPLAPNSRPVPDLPSRSNSFKKSRPPSLHREVNTKRLSANLAFPVPPLPPKNKPSSLPINKRNSGTFAAAITPVLSPARSTIEESIIPPPPFHPQMNKAQHQHHPQHQHPHQPLQHQPLQHQHLQHQSRPSVGVLSSWFGRTSVSSNKSAANSISEQTVDYEENYDLLLSRLNENNEELQTKDISFKEQLNTTENTLKSSFQEKVTHFSEESATNEDPANDELNKIDWPFWTQVVNDYSSVAKSDPSKLSKEIAKGIPKQVRGIIWQLVAKSNPKEFIDRYQDLIHRDSPFEKHIQKDLTRTSFVTASGIDQKVLYNVMKVYSLLDTEVGYTQGMAFITVPILMNCSEMESLSLLYKLMYSYKLRSLYLPEMPGLMLTLYEFDRLVEDLLPDLHTHFRRQGIRSSMYASQWFLTLFAYKFPLEFVLRIFDMVITEGFESLLKFAIALVKKNEEKLLTLKFDELLDFLKLGLFNAYQITSETTSLDSEPISANTSTSDLGGFLRQKPVVPPTPITIDSYNVDQLVEDATNVKIIPLTLKRFEEEYEEIHRQEKERREEVEELRLRNNQLKKEIRKIESSFTILNREHVQIANEMINGRMKIVTLEDENKDLKEQNHNLRERIKALQTPTDVEVPSSLEDDLKLTMERNLEVMTKNEELENQVSELLQEVEELKAEQAKYAAVAEQSVKDLDPPSPVKHHRHTSSMSSNWTKSFFGR